MKIRTTFILLLTVLFFALGGDELTVHATDVGKLDVFRTFSCTGTGVGAVTETEFVHLGNHCTDATVFLHLTLREVRELVYLRGNEEHSRTVLTCCHTGTATDTACRIHSLVGINLGDREGVGILCTATIEADIAACLLDLVERVTVYHKVFYHRECSRTPQ